jgi:hypothetical protein
METALREVLEDLERFVVDTHATVSAIADVTAASLAAGVEAGERARRTRLGAVEPLVRKELDRSPSMLQGAGFVAAPNLLDDAAWWLEWFAWTPAPTSTVERLLPETDPAGAHFFDYTLMPWYAGPREGRAQVITGPYVDYLCTDDYTLTFTEAVIVPGLGGFVGVSGADVRVMAVEEAFLARLRASGRLLAIVNDLGRVVVSNSAKLLSGNLVGTVDVPALFADGDPRLHPVAGSELGLLDLGPRTA